MTGPYTDYHIVEDILRTNLNITINGPVTNIDEIPTFVDPEDLVKHHHHHKHITDDQNTKEWMFWGKIFAVIAALGSGIIDAVAFGLIFPLWGLGIAIAIFIATIINELIVYWHDVSEAFAVVFAEGIFSELDEKVKNKEITAANAWWQSGLIRTASLFAICSGIAFGAMTLTHSSAALYTLMHVVGVTSPFVLFGLVPFLVISFGIAAGFAYGMLMFHMLSMVVQENYLSQLLSSLLRIYVPQSSTKDWSVIHYLGHGVKCIGMTLAFIGLIALTLIMTLAMGSAWISDLMFRADAPNGCLTANKSAFEVNALGLIPEFLTAIQERNNIGHSSIVHPDIDRA